MASAAPALGSAPAYPPCRRRLRPQPGILGCLFGSSCPPWSAAGGFSGYSADVTPPLERRERLGRIGCEDYVSGDLFRRRPRALEEDQKSVSNAPPPSTRAPDAS